MKWVIVFALILVVIIAIVLIIGYLLPAKHSVKLTQLIDAPINEVWKKITTPHAFMSWRKDLKRVDVVGSDQWVEVSRHNDKIPFRIISSKPPGELHVMIDSKRLPYGGTWKYYLEPAVAGKTNLTIIEDGEVYNPFFRFMSKYIFGHTSTITTYLKHLQESFK